MRIIRTIRERNKKIQERGRSSQLTTADDPLVDNPPEKHHLISEGKNHKLNLTNWLVKYPGDIALKVIGVLEILSFSHPTLHQDFNIKLKDHLLSRLRDEPYDPTDSQFTRDDRSTLEIIGARIYQHQTFRVNYTTYDIRRAQDCLNPRTKADIMVLSPTGDNHPYRYVRIIGIFHVEVQYLGPGSSNRGIQALEFLLVRWFEVDQYAPFGVDSFKLPRVTFVRPESAFETFGFVDPSQVLRAIHLVPTFTLGQVADGLGNCSFARQQDPNSDQDWKAFYVNMWETLATFTIQILTRG